MTQEQAAKYKDHDEYVLECLNLAKAGLLKTYRVNDEFWRMIEKEAKEKNYRNNIVQTAKSGDNIGITLEGLDKNNINRGDILTLEK